MVFLRVLMPQHRPICCASMESSLSPAAMPCLLKNLPTLGYTFYLRAVMIIVPQTQHFCILCIQKPRERIHTRGASYQTKTTTLWTSKLLPTKIAEVYLRATLSCVQRSIMVVVSAGNFPFYNVWGKVGPTSASSTSYQRISHTLSKYPSDCYSISGQS